MFYTIKALTYTVVQFEQSMAIVNYAKQGKEFNSFVRYFHKWRAFSNLDYRYNNNNNNYD